MIELGKKYKTRDGREVRIYAVDGCREYPVHGAVNVDGEWACLVWRMNGRLGEYQETDSDLVEVKLRIQREVWVNVYPDGQIMHEQRKTADAFSVDNTDRRIACVKLVIDCEEGTGL